MELKIYFQSPVVHSCSESRFEFASKFADTTKRPSNEVGGVGVGGIVHLEVMDNDDISTSEIHLTLTIMAMGVYM